VLNGPSYQVFWSHAARQVLQAFANSAPSPEIRREVARTVRSFDHRLRTDPLLVGEVYRVRGAIREHLAVQDLLANFAVDTARKLVSVRRRHVASRQGS
jgi:hypothetical protein